MSRRMHAVAVVLALSTGAAVFPVSAQTGSQPEPILFQFTHAAGETLYYDFAQSVTLSMEISSMPVTVDVKQMGREAVRTLGVDPDGSTTVEVALEDFHQTAGSQTQDVLLSPVTFTERPNGKIVDIDTTFPYAQLIEDMSSELPDRPLAVGDSWTSPFEAEERGIHFRGTRTTTLAAVESTSGGRVAHFRTTMEGDVTGGNFAALPPGVQATFSGTAHGTGATDWSVDHGSLLGTTTDVNIDGTLEMTSQDQVARGTLKETISVRAQALAPESVTVPAAPPDLRIMAGKGIGTHTLDQSVTELTGQLGPPATVPADGNRPAMLIWPSGLRGYVDATDQNRLLNLQIGDRRIRTDKGIGFGSSRGAVLTTYGLTPTRVDVVDPDGAARYVLIYNDQGIAFALASAGPFFVVGTEGAPANTVVWITVFPPGDAAKIFPPP